MIRAIPANASDNVYSTLLAQSAVHGAMAGYTGFVSGLVNGRHTYIPFNVSFSLPKYVSMPLDHQLHKVLILYSFHFSGQRITERQNKVVITDRMWARMLSSTNQPSFMNPPKEITEVTD